VLREIEARYPDIAFDWKDVREHQQHIEMTAEPRRRRPPTPAEPPAASPEQASAPAPSAASPTVSSSFEAIGAISGCAAGPAFHTTVPRKPTNKAPNKKLVHRGMARGRSTNEAS
jgi:hypothetical protein